MRRHLIIAAGLVVGMRASAYGQSMVQRCEGMVKSRSADAGWSELCQGIFAANGTHGPQDQAAAFQHYQRAAELGNVEAQALLGLVYDRGWAGVPSRRGAQDSAPRQHGLAAAAFWYHARVSRRTRHAPGA